MQILRIQLTPQGMVTETVLVSVSMLFSASRRADNMMKDLLITILLSFYELVLHIFFGNTKLTI